MGIEHDMMVLNARVAELLAHADTLKKHIEAHDFDLARIEAEGLALYCSGTNRMANRMADRMPNVLGVERPPARGEVANEVREAARTTR